MAARIVEAHGGELRVADPGGGERGLSLTMALPSAASDVAERAA